MKMGTKDDTYKHFLICFLPGKWRIMCYILKIRAFNSFFHQLMLKKNTQLYTQAKDRKLNSCSNFGTLIIIKNIFKELFCILALSYLLNFTTETYPEIPNYKKNFMKELLHFTILFSWKSWAMESRQLHIVTVLLYVKPYFLHVTDKWIEMKTAHKTTFVDPLKQLVLFSNPISIVYLHNLTEREARRSGKEVNKAEQREKQESESLEKADRIPPRV